MRPCALMAGLEVAMNRYLALLLLAAACGGGKAGTQQPDTTAGGGSGGGGGGGPDLELPGVVDFGTVRIGVAVRRKLALQNRSAAAITVREVPEILSPFGTSLGCDEPCGERIIPAGGSLELNVDFTPEEEGAAQADLVLRGDLPGGERTIVLRGVGYTPRVLCAPDVLDFGSIVPATSSRRSISCESATAITLDLRLSLSGPEADSYVLPGGTALALAPGEPREIAIELHGSAQATGDRSGKLHVQLEGADVVEPILLSGHVLEAALSIDPDPSPACVRLDPCTTGETAVQRFNLRNVWDTTIDVTDLSMSQDSDPGFKIVPPAPFAVKPSDPFRPSFYDISAALTLRPEQSGEFRGTVVLVSTDPATPVRSICVEATCTDP